MYCKKVKNFSEKLMEYQISLNFNIFIGLSDEALKKINLLAIERLTQNISLNSFKNLFEKKRFLKEKINSFHYYLIHFFLLLILITSHIFLLFIQFINKNRLNIKSSKIIFFGEQGNTTGPGYRFLSLLYPNSSFYSLNGLSKIFNLKSYQDKNIFFGLEANRKSFINGYRFITLFVKPLCHIEIINKQNLKSKILFFCEYLKVIYANEKSKIIAKDTPNNSINIFMCDNNFFNTVHIDRLNKAKCTTAVIQHGTFLAGNIVYIPVLSRYILCCSNREAEYFGNNMSPNKIYILGMPIQILFGINNDYPLQNLPKSQKYNILVLGRNGTIWESELAYQVLSEIEKKNPTKTILVRHHPGANKQSKRLLENIFDNNISISSNSTLMKDIERADIIISFSVDANIICMLAKKKVIFCGEPEAENLYEIGNLFNNLKVANSSQELNDAIEYFSSGQIAFKTNYDTQLINTFGDYSIEKFKNNYIKFISDCIKEEEE